MNGTKDPDDNRSLSKVVTEDSDSFMDALHRHCTTLPLGPVADVPALERLLAAAWDVLAGDDGGMQGYKVLNRMEAVAWNSPVLSFRIERHGGTMMGSTRADVQHWHVDVEKQTVTLGKVGWRQQRPMAGRSNIKRLVMEILDAIRTGRQDERLTWCGEDEVSVKTPEIYPVKSAFKRTLEGRRKRLREGIASALLKEGWSRLGNDTFRRGTAGEKGDLQC
jgi:hypothetical protein